VVALAHNYIHPPHCHFLLLSFPVPEQKGEEGTEKRGERKREEENRRKYQDPEGVAPPSFLSHG
jgi:hypothetical protein